MNHLYDQQTVEVMERVLRPDSNCVDVGCHRGDILRSILLLAPNGRHCAFEPIPALYESLKIAFPSVQMFNLALSDTEGEASFQHVTTNPAYSGLRRRRYERDSEIVEQILIRTAPLDTVLPKDFRMDFLKIDVEGAELQVLRGGLQTIARCRPVIVFEHGLGASDYYGTQPEMVYDLLCKDCARQIFIMASWLEGGAPLTRMEFVRQFTTGENYYFMAAG